MYSTPDRVSVLIKRSFCKGYADWLRWAVFLLPSQQSVRVDIRILLMVLAITHLLCTKATMGSLTSINNLSAGIQDTQLDVFPTDGTRIDATPYLYLQNTRTRVYSWIEI